MCRRIASVVAATCLMALGAPTLKAQFNPAGWIQTDGWNHLLLTGPGCDGGGSANMLQNWVAPHDLGAENPRAFDVWSNIAFNGAAKSFGPAWDPVNIGATWLTNAALEANFPGAVMPNAAGADDAARGLVDLQVMADYINGQRGAGMPFEGLGTVAFDNVLSISTTYIRNNTGGILPVQVCGSSDDSMQIWVNNCIVVNTSVCRGSAGDCEANSLATIGLPNGISKVTVIVWEGGGGWNFRFAVRNTGGGRYNDASTEVDFLGPGTAETGQTNDCVDFNRAYVAKPFNYPLDTGEKTTVTLTGASTGAAGSLFHLEENISANNPGVLSISNVTGGGVVTANTLPDRTEPVVTAAMLTETVHVGNDAGGQGDDVDNGDGTFTSTDTSNGDLWDGGDTFQFRYGVVTGDFDIAVEIVDYEPDHPSVNYPGQNRWGRVGLMARQFDDPGVTPIASQTAAKYDAIFNHGPSYVEQAFSQGRNTHNTAAGHHQPGIPGNPQKARFHRLTRRGNMVQCWASNNPGLGNGSLNPCNDANWQGAAAQNWGATPPASLLVGFANGHHNSWGSANPQVATYRVLSCAASPGGVAPASYTVAWDLDRTALAGGVKYDLAYDGRQQTNHSFTLAGANVLAKPGGVSGVPFDNTQTGPIGAFDNSHDIGYPRTQGSTTHDAGTYTMTASGDDIWAGGDFFQFAYSEVTGDFEATVRVATRTNQEWDGQWGKHGLMARQTADFNAKNSMIQVNLATNPVAVDTPRHAWRIGHLNTGNMRDHFDLEDNVINQDVNQDRLDCRGDCEAIRVPCAATCDATQADCAAACETARTDCRALCAPEDTACLAACDATATSCTATCTTAGNTCRTACTTARDNCNNGCEATFIPSMRQPPWMRMVRRGDAIFTYLAEDDGGSPGTWAFVGADNDANLPDTILVGMALTSHAGNEIGQIEFDNYELTLLESCQDGDCSSGTPIPGAATDFNFPNGTDPTALGFVNVQGGDFRPVVTGGRLRVTSEATASSANAIWFPTDGGNLGAIGFTAEFDAFMTRAGLPGDVNPADGFTFAVVEGNAAFAAGLRGDGGGSIGYDGNTLRTRGGHASFAVEMDNWLGGGDPGNEPAGTGSPDNDGKYHMGIDVSASASSIQTNVQFTGNTNLPNIFSPAGIHVEVSYRPEGRVDVLVSANDGSFPRTHILSHCIPPLIGADLLIGFTGGTGGATCTQEVDNVSLNLSCCETTYDSVSIAGATTSDLNVAVPLTATLTGADGAATYTWSLVSGTATLSSTSGASINVTPTAAGNVVVRVDANDGSCGGAFDLHSICSETPDSVVISGPSSANLSEPTTLTATLTGGDGAASYAWTAVPGGIATVADNGDGTATITCTAGGDVVIGVAVNDGACSGATDTHDFECIEGGTQRIGDENQDGALNISDPVSLLNHLFSAVNPTLPCGDGTRDDPGNIALLDVNASNSIDISDPVWTLNFLFAGGPIMKQCPANPCPCATIAGCPDNPLCVDTP